MSRPSDPLLERLRQVVASRPGATSALALRSGLPVPRVESILDGAESMTVDELILISQALELEPEDLGMELDGPGGESGESGESGGDVWELPYEAPEDDASNTVEAALSEVVDASGNHARQLFEVGFSLGCTFFFQASVDELDGSGVPAAVLERYADGELPIQLDAAYHSYNEPLFDEDSITMKLSFDSIYTCTFPWTSIRRVAFFPDPPEPEPEPEPAPEPEPPRGGAPFLRLVE